MRDCGSIQIILKIFQETVKSMNIPSEYECTMEKQRMILAPRTKCLQGRSFLTKPQKACLWKLQ